jgi:hypothetical protein
MIKHSALKLTIVAVLVALLTFASPAKAQSHVMMLEALDKVHHAWHPSGPPPPNTVRTQLLTEALHLLQDDPYSGYNGHKFKAMRYIRAALDQIAMDDPYNKVNDYLQDAVRQMNDALSDNQDGSEN